MRRNLLLIIFVCTAMIMVSCSEDNLKGLPDNSGESTELRCIDNLLVFPDNVSLQKALSVHASNGLKESFVSQQNIFDLLVEKEYQRALYLKGLSDEEYGKVDRHCDYYRELLEKQFIKETGYTDGSQLYQLNLCLPTYAKVLNAEGFFAVNDTIYQVTANQFKIWKGGDIKNYRVLNEVSETDVARGIYVCDYSASEARVKTRSLFPLYSVDQEVAYWGSDDPYYNPVRRGIVTFYDKTVLVFPDSYKRDIYIRVSYQEKVDGRNYVFVNTGFQLSAFFSVYVDKQPAPEIGMFANGTSADIWYTVYFPYEMFMEGKQSQTANDRYWNITSFALEVAHRKDNKFISTKFRGDRQEPLYGIFNYRSDGSIRLNTLLPQ